MIENLQNHAEWVGNTAGIIVLVSLLMRSLVKLRWINLLGSIIFCVYGYIVNAPAIVLTNFGISLIDLYYLYKMAKDTGDFRLVAAEAYSGYFQHFWETNGEEIRKFFGENPFDPEQHEMHYMLRGNQIAGIMVGHKQGNDYHLLVDYVIEEYRDFKLGRHFFREDTTFFRNKGVDTLIAKATSPEYERFLVKMGFQKESDIYKLRM